MSSIIKLCNKSILLNNGLVHDYSLTEKVITDYLFLNNENGSLNFKNSQNFDSIEFLINNSKNNLIAIGKDNQINVKISGYSKIDCILEIELRLFGSDENPLIFFSPGHNKETGKWRRVKKGNFTIEENIILPKNINSGKLKSRFYLTEPGKCIHLESNGNITFEFMGIQMPNGHVFEIDKAGLLFVS